MFFFMNSSYVIANTIVLREFFYCLNMNELKLFKKIK